MPGNLILSKHAIKRIYPEASLAHENAVFILGSLLFFKLLGVSWDKYE